MTDPEALEWPGSSCAQGALRFYLDRSGQEFGPFRTDKMRAWRASERSKEIRKS